MKSSDSLRFYGLRFFRMLINQDVLMNNNRELISGPFYCLAKNTPSIVYSQRRDLGGDELAQKMS